jgi:Lar family restriction alleviation protein
MTTATLLPCPFCGEEASIEPDSYGIEVVRCCYCGASAGDGATRDPVSARVEKWNRRARLTEGAGVAAGEPTAIEAIASWLETSGLFPGDTSHRMAPIYERAWNNARHDAARQLRNGNWRKP